MKMPADANITAAYGEMFDENNPDHERYKK